MPDPMPMPVPDEDCEDCVRTVTNYKTVQVPCTRNVTRTYTIKVPKTVTKQVPKSVPYVDYETRTTTVPVTSLKNETRYRNEQQCYQVPVTKTETVMVPTTKKVAKTVYVDVPCTEKRYVNKIDYEDRYRTVTKPYTVQVPHTDYVPKTEQVPVKKWKTEYETKYDTIYHDEMRTVCQPVTKMVTKKIPVVTVVPVQPPPVPPHPHPPTPGQIVRRFNQIDTNNDGVVDVNEALASRGWYPVPGGGGGGGGY